MKLILIFLFVLFAGLGRLFSQSLSNDSLNNTINPDSVYFNVDIPSEHPNGKEARIRFMEKNIDAAIGIKNGAPAGIYKIRIVCIIDTSGKFIAIVPETHEGYGMEKEVMRVIKLLPAFKSAMKNGIAVKSKVIFPISFMSRSQ